LSYFLGLFLESYQKTPKNHPKQFKMRFTSALSAIAVLAFTDMALAAPAPAEVTPLSRPDNMGGANQPVEEPPVVEAPVTTEPTDGNAGGLSLTAQLRLADT
jgi:hypothetical protein